MRKVLLFTWITLIVVLHVAADIGSNDYAGLCEKCDEDNTYPECSMDNSMLLFNLTLHCQKSNGYNCILGIVETLEGESDTNINVFVCQLKDTNMDLLVNELERDHIQVVSIDEKHQMAMETTTAKEMGIHFDENIGTNTEDDIKAVPSTKMPLLNMITDAVTDNDANIKDNLIHTYADANSSVAYDQTVAIATPIAPENIELSSVIYSESVGLSEPESMAFDNENSQDKHKPEVSLSESSPDYQGDEPKVEIQTAGEAEHNEMPLMESNALDVELIKQTENIVESNAFPVTQVTNTEIGDNAIDITTRAGVVTSSMQKCFTCSSTNDPKCITKPENQTYCKAIDGTKNGCYTLLKKTVLQRGCFVDLQKNELKSCMDSLNTKCRICDQPSCNKDPWPQCYNCSSKDDPQCAWWGGGAEITVARTLCPDVKDQCRSSVDATGITWRHCSNATVMCSNAPGSMKETCQVCSANLCNAGVFPAARRRCLQCAGTIECAMAKKLKGLPCLLYKSHDRCFLYANDTNQMIRGCASASAEFQRCGVIGGSTKCKTCSDSDSCNDTPLLIAPKLSCSRCDSRHQISKEEDIKALGCVWAQSTENMVKCTNKYPYYLQESCLSIYHPDMQWAVRDCSFDFGACEPSDLTCQSCSANGCNAQNMKWEYCLQCNSEMESSCATDAAKIELKKCPAKVQPYELRGCYTKKDAENNVTTRGCISDLTEDGMSFCKNKTKLCTLCYEHGCNNRLAPSNANSIMKHEFTLVLEMLLVTILFYNSI